MGALRRPHLLFASSGRLRARRAKVIVSEVIVSDPRQMLRQSQSKHDGTCSPRPESVAAVVQKLNDAAASRGREFLPRALRTV